MALPMLKQAPLSSEITPANYSKLNSDDYIDFLASKGLDHKNVPAIINGDYFQVVEVNQKNIKALCMMCSKLHMLSATLKSTSNLLLHMKISKP